MNFPIFGQIFFALMIYKNSYLKLLIRQPLVLLQRLSFVQIFVFRQNLYIKKRRNFSEETENFRILVELSKLLC